MSVGIIKKSRSYPSQADYRYCMLQRTQTAGVGAANVHQTMKYKAFNCGYASSE